MSFAYSNSWAYWNSVLKTLVVSRFTASGTFTSPALLWSKEGNANEVFVECWGAGAGGTTAVGGGGGGAYAGTPNVSVAPSTGYTVTVAAGAVADTNAGDTSFNTTTVVAKGGLSGTNGSTGGLASASTGTIKYSGATAERNAANCQGGGCAGDSGDATNGGGIPGPTNGGFGQNTTIGRLIGAGGGSTAASGAAGATGECRVTYMVPATAGFPRVLGRTWGRDTAGGTTRNITIPAGTGGRLILIVASDGIPVISMSGWTALTQVNQGTSQVSGRLFHIVSDGAEPVALATDASEQVAWECIRVVGPTGGVPGAPEWNATSSSSTNADPPSFTPSGGSKSYLWLAAAGWDVNGTFSIMVPPTNFGNDIFTMGSNNAGAALCVAERFSTASVMDPGVFSSNNEQWWAATVAIAPS